MNTIKSQILTVLLVVLFHNGYAQGFDNLDFEQATIVHDPSSPVSFVVNASDAIPSWTAYISGVPQNDIWYNTFPLGAAEVTLQGINNGGFPPPADGNYFASLWGAFNPTGNPNAEVDSAAIGQTGQIPASAQSLTFLGTMGGMQVTFNGNLLNFITVGSMGNYKIYGADISAYSGKTGQLLFTDPYYGNTYGGPSELDDIQFSSTAIPEPSEFTLSALGAFLLGFRRLKNSSVRR